MTFWHKVILSGVILWFVVLFTNDAEARPVFTSRLIEAPVEGIEVRGVDSAKAMFTFKRARVSISHAGVVRFIVRGIRLNDPHTIHPGVTLRVSCLGKWYDSGTHDITKGTLRIVDRFFFDEGCMAPIVMLRRNSLYPIPLHAPKPHPLSSWVLISGF